MINICIASQLFLERKYCVLMRKKKTGSLGSILAFFLLTSAVCIKSASVHLFIHLCNKCNNTCVLQGSAVNLGNMQWDLEMPASTIYRQLPFNSRPLAHILKKVEHLFGSWLMHPRGVSWEQHAKPLFSEEGPVDIDDSKSEKGSQNLRHFPPLWQYTVLSKDHQGSVGLFQLQYKTCNIAARLGKMACGSTN